MIANKLAPAVLVIFSLLVLGWAALRAQAAWHYFAAQSLTGQMYQADAITAAGIARANEHLERALQRFPAHPDYLDLAGYLKELQANQPGVVGDERSTLLESAAGDYRGALAARPRWPYGWANLLSVKDKLGEVDSEFNRALEKAVELGPWEPRVQLQVIRSGIKQWPLLNEDQRALVRANLADALLVQPREAFEVVRFYARPDLVCGESIDHAPIERWCGQVN